MTEHGKSLKAIEEELLQAARNQNVRMFQDFENRDLESVCEVLRFTKEQRLLKFSTKNASEPVRYEMTMNTSMRKRRLRYLKKNDPSPRVRSKAESEMRIRSKGPLSGGSSTGSSTGVLDNTVKASLRDQPFI